jgi:sec-independent protein translocase protein TatC
LEARDWAQFFLEIRKNLIRLFAILAIVTFSFFPFSPILVSFVVEEMFPYQNPNPEEAKRLAEQIMEIANRINENANNTTLVREEMKKISRLSASYMGPVVITPLEALVLSLKLSLAVGVAAVVPYLILILSKVLRIRGWLRVSAKPYAAASIALFILGCIYGFIMVKLIIRFLHSITISYGVIPLYSLSEFVTFVLLMILLFGLFFEIPVVMFFLAKNRVVSYEGLKKYRRYAYVLFFVIAAIVTPTVDIFTQTMLALPMCVLFEFGMVLIKFAK